TNMYSITGDAARQSVVVQLPTRTFEITFTDRPAPPEPPAQTGEASSMTAAKAGGLGEKLGEAVINAFGRGLIPGRVLPVPGGDPFAPRAPADDPFDPFAP